MVQSQGPDWGTRALYSGHRSPSRMGASEVPRGGQPDIRPSPSFLIYFLNLPYQIVDF